MGQSSTALLAQEGHILTGVPFDGPHVGLGEDARGQANKLVLLLWQTVFRMLPHHPAGHFVEGEEIVSDASEISSRVPRRRDRPEKVNMVGLYKESG